MPQQVLLQRFGTDTVGLTRHVGALGRTHGRDEATQRGMEELTRDNGEADESYFVLTLAAD